METSIRLLIVDDHPLLRQALLRTLHGHRDIEVIGEAADGQEAIEKARELGPDVILMDLGLPGKSGIQAIHEILENQPEVRILVLSGQENDLTITAALRAGAIGFLGKGEQNIDLVKSIRDTFLGMTTLKGSTLQQLLANPAASKKEILFSDALTSREREIIHLITDGDDDRQIAEKLFLTGGTVRSHINHILRKLGLKTRSELIRLILNK